MTENAVYVRQDELMILLNAVSEQRNSSLSVKYPFFDLLLFQYQTCKAEVTHSVKVEQFDEAREPRVPKPQRLADDLATWEDLRDAMLSSGALRYENHEEVATELHRELENLRRANNPNPTFLAFDTNTLYNRLPGRGLPYQFLGGDMSAFRYVVSEGVTDELASAIAHKYQDNDLRSIASKAVGGRLTRELLNRTMKKGRKAKAAKGDVHRLESARQAMIAPCEDLADDKEKNDRLIARSYRAFKEEQHCDLILLTSDEDMQHHAQSERLKSLALRLPRADAGIAEGFLDERVMCRLLHDLAVSLGVIHLSGLDIRVWGDWGGKTLEDWHHEVVKLDMNPSTKVTERLMADLRACRALGDVLSDSAPCDVS